MKEEYVLVRNSMNIHQISKIDLSPEGVDGVVFLTKDPTPMLNRLEELEKYNFYSCYANYSGTSVNNNFGKHNLESPLLLGEINEEADE